MLHWSKINGMTAANRKLEKPRKKNVMWERLARLPEERQRRWLFKSVQHWEVAAGILCPVLDTTLEKCKDNRENPQEINANRLYRGTAERITFVFSRYDGRACNSHLQINKVLLIWEWSLNGLNLQIYWLLRNNIKLYLHRNEQAVFNTLVTEGV